MATDPAARAPASHVVVDGSNIATEGRTAPSLAQLDEAVTSFIAQYGHQKVTVIVDATFGHRIAAGERPDYEEAVLAGELVAPPAGTIGRGDAFILQVARLANADVLSNDSFQELHAEHPWLFETGRLFGGKPVPEVGWVFVSRSPVKGPVSRRATQSSKKARGRATVKASAAASAPMPVPTTPPPRARRGRSAVTTVPEAEDALLEEAAAILEPSVGDTSAPTLTPDEPADGDGRRGKRRRRGAASGGGDTTAREPINDKLPYVSFVIEHPIGSVVQGVVERFSSHGAYVDLGEARGYVPLKALGDPPPRSAKEHFELGETRSFTVTRFDAELRGIDIVPVELVPALLGSGPAAAGLAEDGGYGVAAPTATEVPAPAGAGPAPSDAQEAPVSPAAKKATTRKAPAKKATTAKKSTAKATKAAAASEATQKRAATTAKKTTAKAPATKAAAASKATQKRAAATAKKSTAKAPATKAAAAKKAPAKKSTATEATASKKATATKATAAKKKRAPARAAKKT